MWFFFAEIDVDDDDIVCAGEKIYGMDDEDAVEGTPADRKRKRGAGDEDAHDVDIIESPAVKKVKAVNTIDIEPEIVSLEWNQWKKQVKRRVEETVKV